jgi:hypothetical protein
VAERVGFEPTVRFKTDNALAGRPIRPLWHLSWVRLTSVPGCFQAPPSPLGPVQGLLQPRQIGLEISPRANPRLSISLTDSRARLHSLSSATLASSRRSAESVSRPGDTDRSFMAIK